MQTLVDGIHHFQQHVFPSKLRLFQHLVKGQQPIALLIICSDSRINPNLITHTEPGELFIVRNVGNMVPPHGVSNNGEAAAIEYSVVELKVQDIIVCGHTHCGAMQGMLNPKSRGTAPRAQVAASRTGHDPYHARELSPSARFCLAGRHGPGERTCTAATPGDLPGRGLVARGDLHLHGWMYKIETGEVFHYDHRAKQFVLIEHARQPVDESRNLLDPRAGYGVNAIELFFAPVNHPST